MRVSEFFLDILASEPSRFAWKSLVATAGAYGVCKIGDLTILVAKKIMGVEKPFEVLPVVQTGSNSFRVADSNPPKINEETKDTNDNWDYVPWIPPSWTLKYPSDLKFMKEYKGHFENPCKEVVEKAKSDYVLTESAKQLAAGSLVGAVMKATEDTAALKKDEEFVIFRDLGDKLLFKKEGRLHVIETSKAILTPRSKVVSGDSIPAQGSRVGLKPDPKDVKIGDKLMWVQNTNHAQLDGSFDVVGKIAVVTSPTYDTHRFTYGYKTNDGASWYAAKDDVVWAEDSLSGKAPESIKVGDRLKFAKNPTIGGWKPDARSRVEAGYEFEVANVDSQGDPWFSHSCGFTAFASKAEVVYA